MEIKVSDFKKVVIVAIGFLVVLSLCTVVINIGIGVAFGQEEHEKGEAHPDVVKWGFLAAAIAVVKIINISNEKIEEGIRTFKPLPHRLEDIGTLHGLRYINNSMCTNESAAIASFNALRGAKIVIVGGKQKGDKGHNYLDLLTKESKACVILGENARYIANYFRSKDFKRRGRPCFCFGWARLERQ